jgi:hypothetical protein
VLVIHRVLVARAERELEAPLVEARAEAIFGGGQTRRKHETQPTRFSRLIDYPNIGVV